MPRLAENTAVLLSDLRSRLERVVAAARKEGRDEALAELRSLVSGGAPLRRGPGRPRKGAARASAAAAKPRKKRKNPWATLSPAARLARINAIRKGRGLPLKDSL